MRNIINITSGLFALITVFVWLDGCADTPATYEPSPAAQIENWNRLEIDRVEIWLKNTGNENLQDIAVIAYAQSGGEIVDAGFAYMLNGETLFPGLYAVKEIHFSNIDSTHTFDSIRFTIEYQK